MAYEATHHFSFGGSVSGPAAVVNAAARRDLDQQAAEQEWVADMRQRGVKLAHPDDGWVNRTEHYVDPCYPQLPGHPEVGDLIALGSHRRGARIVRVTEVRDRGPLYEAMLKRKGWRYYFNPEPVAITEPR